MSAHTNLIMQLKTYSHHIIVISWFLYVCTKHFPLPAKVFLDPYTNFSGLLKINSKAKIDTSHFFCKKKKWTHTSIVIIQSKF